MNLVCRKITVTGKVQGVWFRKYTHDKAHELGLKGTVQNLPSGQVLIFALGPPEVVSELEKWCWQGSPESNVQDVASEAMELQPYNSFNIIQ